MDSVRLLITLVSHEGWEVHHMDIKSMFLNGNLQGRSTLRIQQASLSLARSTKCSS
jgi:hypothetical protein